MSADAVLFAFPLGDRRMHRANELDDSLFLSRAALLLKVLLIILVSDHPGDRFKFCSFAGNSVRTHWSHCKVFQNFPKFQFQRFDWTLLRNWRVWCPLNVRQAFQIIAHLFSFASDAFMHSYQCSSILINFYQFSLFVFTQTFKRPNTALPVHLFQFLSIRCLCERVSSFLSITDHHFSSKSEEKF